MKTPHALCKLRNELNNTTLSSVPQWNETSGLQYLDAVVKEALRLHTPVGLILERVVPQDGTTICGRPFQRGTIVGCNPYVVAHDSSIYGKQYDVDEFWPERWLEADESTRSEMDRCSLVFGGGKRTCIGRNISLLEIKKLVPLLLLRYEVSYMILGPCVELLLTMLRFPFLKPESPGVYGTHSSCTRLASK
jgi:cytochrome P450